VSSARPHRCNSGNNSHYLGSVNFNMQEVHIIHEEEHTIYM
jgi:hypothetical protein